MARKKLQSLNFCLWQLYKKSKQYFKISVECSLPFYVNISSLYSITVGFWCSYNQCWKKTISLLLFTTTFCVGSRIITLSQRHQKHVDVSVEQWGRVVKNSSNVSKLPQIFFFPRVNFHCIILKSIKPWYSRYVKHRIISKEKM